MHTRGFTLIELVIAVAVVGILAAIAYPSYQAQMQKSRRAEAKAALVAAAVQLERYFTERNTYATATLGTTGVYPAQSEHGYYTLAVTGLGTTTFTLRATPAGVQSGDPCGVLAYDNAGNKTKTGSLPLDQCW